MAKKLGCISVGLICRKLRPFPLRITRKVSTFQGIGTPPFYQDYTALLDSPPQDNPYYSFFLNEEDGWIDHHSMAVDGPIIHRDADNPDLLHLYLMSYERHLLVAHFELLVPVEATSDEAVE